MAPQPQPLAPTRFPGRSVRRRQGPAGPLQAPAAPAPRPRPGAPSREGGGRRAGTPATAGTCPALPPGTAAPAPRRARRARRAGGSAGRASLSTAAAPRGAPRGGRSRTGPCSRRVGRPAGYPAGPARHRLLRTSRRCRRRRRRLRRPRRRWWRRRGERNNTRAMPAAGAAAAAAGVVAAAAAESIRRPNRGPRPADPMRAGPQGTDGCTGTACPRGRRARASRIRLGDGCRRRGTLSPSVAASWPRARRWRGALSSRDLPRGAREGGERGAIRLSCRTKR